MDFKEIPDAYKDIRIKTSEAIEQKSSFEIKEIDDMGFAIGLIEDILKYKKVKYRVRTNNRANVPSKVAGGGAAIIGASVAMEATAIAAPIAVATVGIAGMALTGVGAVALAGIAAHRIFTAQPEYEVVKYPQIKEIHLVYKR